MTVVRFTDGRRVDVIDADCEHRPCFALGFDKGSFTPGVGYTRYHEGGPRPVCWTRHMNGCPYAGYHVVCWDCRAVLGVVMAADPDDWPPLPDRCPECGAETGHMSGPYRFSDVLYPPGSCCDAPRVPRPRRRPPAYRQRCLSCGTWLTGARLETARAAS